MKERRVRLYPWWWYRLPPGPFRETVYNSFRWSPVGWWWAGRRQAKRNEQYRREGELYEYLYDEAKVARKEAETERKRTQAKEREQWDEHEA